MVVHILALFESPEHLAELTDCRATTLGHEVLVVNSFAKAKSTLLMQSYDLTISDVHLQNGGTVFDFLKWVKNQPRLFTIPFILLSLTPSELAKYMADGVRTAARALGATKYISMETFDSPTLLSEVLELLPRHEERQLIQS